MNKHLIVGILLAVSLAACSSKPVKEAPKPPVEDKTPAKQVVPPPKAPEPAAPEATTKPMTESTILVNPLKDPNNILSHRSVFFDYDKDEVKPEYRPLVEAHAKYLLAHPDAKIFLQGNCDERGSREYNLALGQRRSVAVKKVMNLLGVQDKQIETVSYGEEKANPNCRDEACWKENRHADIVYQGE